MLHGGVDEIVCADLSRSFAWDPSPGLPDLGRDRAMRDGAREGFVRYVEPTVWMVHEVDGPWSGRGGDG